MSKTEKKTLITIIIIGLIYLFLFYFPNSIGSDDPQMIAVFEPDESAQLSPILNMIERSETLKKSVLRFFFYNYYFYGFPFFAYSAILILPLRLLGESSNFPLIMTILRQAVSVLPMTIALILLVYSQTKFKSRLNSLLLFVFLLFLPGVVFNNLWWHPDSLSFLFIAATFFFLVKDDNKLSSDFYLAALFSGFATGTKWIGMFFFLTIPIYIIWSTIIKKKNIKKAVISAILFVAIMVSGIIISNPILVFANARTEYLKVFQWQRNVLSTGYEVFYDQGISHILKITAQYFGKIWFIVILLFGSIWGIVKDKRRLMNVLIISFSIPYFIYQTIFVANKIQYLLPPMIPLISSVINIFDLISEFWQTKTSKFIAWKKIIAVSLGAILIVQFALYIIKDVNIYTGKLDRVNASLSLEFYETFEKLVVPNLPEDKIFRIYKDVRLYLPDSDHWKSFSKYETLDLAYFNEHGPDLILLMQQRIYDYTQDSALENAIDPEQMLRSQEFYNDAHNEDFDGYTLIFRDPFGLAYIKNSLYEEYFEN
ncbi:MAG: hypothetical protein HON98_13745 [Chloroflexi bacterium]|jgi:hypothetical protein|nr:hypothetical protein [Chloroflexota bacterium]MBT3671077.1 hypothetical protein [Chloroflexota bacterium]MBT4002144.1 hypothetical protein [Chloroflexota bacterium]MBT4304892.1 hypothetical protein [Chloroflexota bacterium]MBT4534020.1 hypothetical protein [Chloroflexota bacterium]